MGEMRGEEGRKAGETDGKESTQTYRDRLQCRLSIFVNCSAVMVLSRRAPVTRKSIVFLQLAGTCMRMDEEGKTLEGGGEGRRRRR